MPNTNKQKQKVNTKETFGPEFELGPGWGKIFSVWLKKYKVILIVFLLIVAFFAGGLFFLNKENVSKNQDLSASLNEVSFITVLPERYDGFIKVARRALNQFLDQNKEIEAKLKPEHRIFIEQYLYDLNRGVEVKVGQVVNLSVVQIKEATDKALALQENTLSKWRQYVK